MSRTAPTSFRARIPTRLAWLLLALLLAGTATRIAPTGPTLPSQAQAPDRPEVRVTLYGNTVAFRTLPDTLVSAELADGDGTKAEGIGYGDADGEAVIVFPVGSSTILPGDRLTLSRPQAQPLVVDVPALAADLDAESDRIGGLAPAGASLRLSLRADATADPIERQVDADADGMFLLELAGELDLAAGEAAGELVYDHPEGFRFELPFAALSTQVTLGAPILRGQASPGTELQFEVRKADGGSFQLGPALMAGDPAYVIGSAENQALEAGDQILLRQTGSPLLTGERVYSATLEAVTLNLNPADELAEGSGPADMALQLLGDNMDGDIARWTTTTASDGSYAVELGDRIELGPGWRVRAAYQASPGIGVGAVALLRKARVGVGMPFGQGRIEPGHVLTITLRSASGDVKTQGRTFSGDLGDYSMPFGFGAMPAAGDRVEIELDTLVGDPIVLTVPELRARSDVENDRVVGQAPPDATVDVLVTSDDSQPSVTTVAGADGSYSADFGDQIDLQRPAGGLARITSLGGDEFVTTWAAIRLAASVGNSIQGNYVTGNGPLGRIVNVQLLSPEGELVGQAAGPVFTGGIVAQPGSPTAFTPQFFVQLTDATGLPVQMLPGDRLRVTSGDEQVEVEVPPIDAVVFVDGDRITGRTGPDLPITLRIADTPLSFGTRVETEADAAGRFNVDLSGTRDIRFGDFIQLAPQVDGHEIFDTILAPGLVVDLDQAVVLGSLAPEIGVEVELLRGGQQLFLQQTGTDATGAFFAQFPGQDGMPFLLQTGDRLIVRPDDPTLLPLELELPELTLTWDVESDSVGGSTMADGQLTLLSGLAYARAETFGIAQGWPDIDASGRFDASFVPQVDLKPGHQLIALLRPPEGHYVARSRTVPILNAEHSGPNACGFGAPRQTVDLVLQQDGQPLADSRATARFDGYFSSVHTDAQDEAIKTESGHWLDTRLDELPVAMELPEISLALDWQSQVLQGRGPANATWYLGPALPCVAQQQPSLLNLNTVSSITGQTDADGDFVTGIPAAFTSPGSGLELAFYLDDPASSADDHRYFRQAYRALARIFIRTAIVDGRSNALDATRVTLRDAAGEVLAGQDAAADTNGNFRVELQDVGGEPVPIEPGHRILLETPGETRTIEVEPLEFDWSADSPVFGSAPANRVVQVQLRLASGAFVGLSVPVDDEGRFAFTEDQVPPRAGWDLSDIIGVRVTLGTPGGHQIIDQTPGFVGPLPQPESPPTIYLPAAYRSAGGRTLDQGPRVAPAAVDPSGMSHLDAGPASQPSGAVGSGAWPTWAWPARPVLLAPERRSIHPSQAIARALDLERVGGGRTRAPADGGWTLQIPLRAR